MKKFLFTLIIIVFTFACDDNGTNDSPCGKKLIVDNYQFNHSPKDSFQFNNVEIIGNCMNVSITRSGGCGKCELTLIASENIIATNPPQRSIRLSLKNNDPCESLVQEQISFDLRRIRILNCDKILLKLQGWNEQLIYQYDFID